MYRIKGDTNLVTLVELLKDTKKETTKGLNKALTDTAFDIQKEAKKTVKDNHFKTGKLYKGIKAEVDLKKGEATITSTADYSSFVEFGTKPHTIRPKNKKALRFYNRGKVVFTKEVRHPGTKGSFFLRSSVDNNTQKFIKRLEEAVSDGSN